MFWMILGKMLWFAFKAMALLMTAVAFLIITGKSTQGQPGEVTKIVTGRERVLG